MSNVVIRVENISKQYRLGLIGSGSLQDDFKRKIAAIRGKEDPFLKIGTTNDQNNIEKSEYIWSLKNINFEVKQGEVLGIIGANGAGKSTLLKILSKVTAPTTGSVKIKGRIASLLEVGTGFHPELTGKENVFLNGAILGMNKLEISKKFEEIVAFSGVEKYINTPVKRYSSGMYVRLAFAVAAHLDSEILIIDEVLAVGDLEFQKKCLGKMKNISQEQGKTVLFVSHNMTATENLCDSVLTLKNGNIIYSGNTQKGILEYLNPINYKPTSTLQNQIKNLNTDSIFELTDVKLCQNNIEDNFLSNKEINFSMKYNLKNNILGLRVGFDIIDSLGTCVFRSYHDDLSESINQFNAGSYVSQGTIPANLLKNSSYVLSLSIGIHNLRWIIFDKIKITFHVLNLQGINKLYADERPGVIMPKIVWQTFSI